MPVPSWLEPTEQNEAGLRRIIKPLSDKLGVEGAIDELKNRMHKAAERQGVSIDFLTQRTLATRDGVYIPQKKTRNRPVDIGYVVPYLAQSTSSTYRTFADFLQALAIPFDGKHGAFQAVPMDMGPIVAQMSRGVNSGLESFRNGREMFANKYPRSEAARRFYNDAYYKDALKQDYLTVKRDVSAGKIEEAKKDIRDIDFTLGLSDDAAPRSRAEFYDQKHPNIYATARTAELRQYERARNADRRRARAQQSSDDDVVELSTPTPGLGGRQRERALQFLRMFA